MKIVIIIQNVGLQIDDGLVGYLDGLVGYLGLFLPQDLTACRSRNGWTENWRGAWSQTWWWS